VSSRDKTPVSVVIAYFNGSAWIERSLKSALSQTHKPAEVIVVDDGSNEEESEFLQSLAMQHHVMVIKQENSGQSVARNNGISNAKSEFVCLLDQDDFFLPRHIEILLDTANTEDPSFGFSYGDLWRSNEAGDVLAHTCVNVDAQHPLMDIKVMIRNNMNILPSATLIKRSAFLDVGGFDPALRGYEDDDLFLRFFLAGYSNYFTPEPVTVWTINTSSTSFSESMSKSRFVYFKKLLGSFPSGSLLGTRVFGELISPRFGFHFADDVIASAFKRDEHFQVRLERLKYFRSLMKKSSEVSSSVKRKYLISSAPLVVLSQKSLRLFLLFVLKSGIVLGTFRVPLLARFVRKYASSKEVFSK
jgi:glycosyltransferase involved in cell wall biosynthesis